MKKQNLLKLIAIAVVGSTLLLACDKNDTPAPLPEPVQKLMFDWKITDITTPKVTNPATDSSILKTCMSDDIIQFASTGYDFQDGTTKCDSTIFPYSKGSWAYDISKDSIQLGNGTPQSYQSWKVLKLNDSVLQVRYVDSVHFEDNVTKTISFKH